ncbi:hypothetical protein SAMN02745664_101276 [Moraxella cuniculi DSM 21768]|uniref:Uncharacterized protein n=1 Tax=Moraxella cuniculi DSM 21768 TaxID=1122245 RepID=A0A1N7DHU4_9GAMM|nr:hypothetical protein [Moraxella cuniculi]OOS08070.1 hypothetical protein B0189_01685 [Moraxella cuniculi]SIR75364.1 hypothetical protein SAMN02745664_101276 [Moraxella cuniculi DSM 21768]
MPMILHIDDNTDAQYSLSMLLLDDAIKILINNGELDKEKLAKAIMTAKDDLFELNKDNDDNLLKMRLFMIAHTLQCRYLELT